MAAIGATGAGAAVAVVVAAAVATSVGGASGTGANSHRVAVTKRPGRDAVGPFAFLGILLLRPTALAYFFRLEFPSTRRPLARSSLTWPSSSAGLCAKKPSGRNETDRRSFDM